MRKFLTYSGFAIASLLVILLFVTATTYLQLGLAVILYPAIAYFAVKIFFRKPAAPAIKTEASVSPAPTLKESEDVADSDKRTFLKLVGATGIFFFVSSLLGKRVDTLLLGRSLGSGVNSQSAIPNTEASQNASLAASGYSITEVDDSIISYYGFTNNAGAWLIMKEDTETSSFRYAKGNSNFPGNWGDRASLKYDYYYNLF